MRNRKWSTAFALLMILQFSAGCAEATSAPQGVFAESITIAEGNELVYESWGIEQKFGPAEQVEVQWENGVVRLNDLVHKPHPAGPEERHPVEELQALYGEVEFIRTFLAGNSGDPEQLWNQAYQAWISQRSELERSAAESYRRLLGQGVAPEEAADESAKLLLKSVLVESAERDLKAPPGDHQAVLLRWQGLTQTQILMLAPHEDTASSATWVSREQAEELVLLLKRLESTAIRIRIRLAHGNISILTGSYLSQESR